MSTPIGRQDEPMDPFFALFNCHINNAQEGAMKEFINTFGQDVWDKRIQPFMDKGIMSIFDKKPNKYTRWFVMKVQEIVNKEQVEETVS
jgi:hypothetical protein